MKVEYRSEVEDFFGLIADRREQIGDDPELVIREAVINGEWMVEAWLRLVPLGLVGLHELKLRQKVGYHLGDGVEQDDAWPTHSEAIIAVRNLVPVLRAGASDYGFELDEALEVTDSVLDKRPRIEQIANATGRRLGAALLWKRRGAA